jgi:hypothetical protein
MSLSSEDKYPFQELRLARTYECLPKLMFICDWFWINFGLNFLYCFSSLFGLNFFIVWWSLAIRHVYLFVAPVIFQLKTYYCTVLPVWSVKAPFLFAFIIFLKCSFLWTSVDSIDTHYAPWHHHTYPETWGVEHVEIIAVFVTQLLTIKFLWFGGTDVD